MTEHDTLDTLRLARSEGVGPVSWRRLLARYGSASAALEQLPALARSGGRAGAPGIPSRSDAEREIEALHRLGATLLFANQPAYPPLLALRVVDNAVKPRDHHERDIGTSEFR